MLKLAFKLMANTVLRKKSPIIIPANFGSVFVPEDKRKPNPKSLYKQISKTYCL